MWHCRNGRIRGVLNDFDLSSYRGATSGSSKQRTGTSGTRPFMAHELHDVDANGDPPVHLYRHDLESIFYIIILLTCAYALRTEPGDEGSYLDTIPSSTYEDSYQSWFSMTDAQLYDKKCKVITNLNGRSLPVPDKSFCGFTDWINDMHTQFKKGVLDKADALKAASPLYEEDEEDGDGDEETDQDDDDMDVDAVAAFDNETMDGAVSYDIILTIMKTFGKKGRGKNRRGKKQSLEMMYPTAKKD